MPNVTISIYLNDEDYLLYVKDKEYMNDIARSAIKDKIVEKKGKDHDC